MTHQITVTYTRQIIRKAVAHFWFRYMGWSRFVLIGAWIVGISALLVSGDRSWLVGALGVAGTVLLLSSAGLYVASLRRSMSNFNRMESKVVTFTFSDDRLSIASEVGNSELTWKVIQQVWRFPDVWLLFASKTYYVTLPIIDIAQPAREFIIEQVTRHGGRVA